MSLNQYLNLRFVNALRSFRTVPFTTAEIYYATQTRQTAVLAYTSRMFNCADVHDYDTLKDHLIGLRDRSAWKIGVFKFFHEYYHAHPDELRHLSLKNNSAEMEKFISGIKINQSLMDFYTECGHDPHMALEYSVSKIICNERRLGWMNLFCAKFGALLDLDDDTGIIADDLVRHIDLIDSAAGLGIISNTEFNYLMQIAGQRIIVMFGSWGKFLAGVLQSRLYALCMSTAEVRYLPMKAQEVIDNFYLCCHNNLAVLLPLPGWDKNDLPVLMDALRPFVNADKLDKIWSNTPSSVLNGISRITLGFNFYRRYLIPVIEKYHISQYFREFSKFDEFIPVASGREFRIYFRSLRLSLAEGEYPLFIMKFFAFTNYGVWRFDLFEKESFMPWPDKITVVSDLPINRNYGSIVLPLYVQEIGCRMNMQLPYIYLHDHSFTAKTAAEQAVFLKPEINALCSFFTELPLLCKKYGHMEAEEIQSPGAA